MVVRTPTSTQTQITKRNLRREQAKRTCFNSPERESDRYFNFFFEFVVRHFNLTFSGHSNPSLCPCVGASVCVCVYAVRLLSIAWFLLALFPFFCRFCALFYFILSFPSMLLPILRFNLSNLCVLTNGFPCLKRAHFFLYTRCIDMMYMRCEPGWAVNHIASAVCRHNCRYSWSTI